MICKQCGESLHPKRVKLGYSLCLECGEEDSERIAKSRCIVAPHKQGYMFFTDAVAREIVKGINNKGGLIK
jgi:predicted RNA-binding Zn-ribbon protein involved in translation (DUF1610 family)